MLLTQLDYQLLKYNVAVEHMTDSSKSALQTVSVCQISFIKVCVFCSCLCVHASA